jgi:hypothetical protein
MDFTLPMEMEEVQNCVGRATKAGGRLDEGGDDEVLGRWCCKIKAVGETSETSEGTNVAALPKDTKEDPITVLANSDWVSSGQAGR